MGWVTLNLRKMDDQVLHNNFQAQLLGISRRRQQVARNKGYQTLLINNERKTQLNDIKAVKDDYYNGYLDAYNKYTQLKKAYNKAKSDSETYSNKKSTDSVTVLFDENFNPVYNKEGNGFQEQEPAYKNDKGEYIKPAENGENQGTPVTEGYWLGEEYVVQDGNHKMESVSYYQEGNNPPIPVLTKEQLSELEQMVEKAEDDKSTAYTAYNNAFTEYEDKKKNLNDEFDQQLQSLEEETTTEENSIDLEQTQIEAQLESFTQELQAVKQQVSQDMQNVVIKLG